MSIAVNDLQRKYDELVTAIEAWKKRARVQVVLMWATLICAAANIAACIYTLFHVHRHQ